MRLLSVAAVSLFVLSTNFAIAKGLGGNLDYSLHSEGQEAKLVLTNKRSDTPATVTSVAILLPAGAGKESKQIAVPMSQVHPISLKATIPLGSVLNLAQQIAPGKNTSQFKMVSVSENNSCTNCDSVGFALKISVEHPGGVKQDTLTEAYLHYFVR
ncbi:hypothetical protein RG903_08720 [Thermithiobacillus tepidarius DSM 3134]|uniref:hypothetical protein n=1 Tax=Thermithiobacillus tepidarius TaxID=929 RepID=UPI0004910C3A|nr:hypothetical protein [Thermithiobacillus tepidarius]